MRRDVLVVMRRGAEVPAVLRSPENGGYRPFVAGGQLCAFPEVACAS